MSSDRKIPRRYIAIWSVLGVLFTLALFTTGETSWWLSLICLLWFAVWETHGIATKAAGDTLSESCWAILDVQDNSPVNRSLVPLVMGLFTGAACLFIGIVDGASTQTMSVWARVVAAFFVACGTLAFLVRHFRRGDSL